MDREIELNKFSCLIINQVILILEMSISPLSYDKKLIAIFLLLR